MGETKIGPAKIVAGLDALSEEQKQQFRRVVMQGLKDKFINHVKDEKVIQSIVDMWCKYRLLPMDEVYAAIGENTGEVLGILMLNNFKDPGLWMTIKCALDAIGIAGLKNTFKMARPFMQLDSYNHRLMPRDVAVEIYLVATKEDCKGRGVGTLLMSHVLDEIKSKCKCGQPDGSCSCKAMLLVFAKNPAKRLYERLGFLEADRLATPKLQKVFGDDYDTIVRMEKPLLDREV